MKTLSDYKGEEAIELWGDLLEPLTKIISDKEIANTIRSGKPKILIAKTILANHKTEATEILLRIDPTPIDGLNILLRLLGIISEIGESEELQTFFGFAETANKESSGSAMESTEVEGK